ncbi:hypothetical protein PVAND_006790 [Polypedilum vanderplanki]|uniref:Uncharacterized protein n=1 Tax=Polypedilum vanderplanki TaxID=319348 RepID=A0A9J6C4S4_POLVA|nr:hypothetical protein PVAND_006790 [Polypedilum vanderplanki]
MSTFNKYSNKTYNANRNATYKGNGNATYNVASNLTFDATPNQTFNVKNNATFNVNPNKTHNINRTFNVKANGTLDVKQPFNEDAYGPQADFSPEYNSEEKLFLNQLEILCNEMRLFIMSLYKFFCEHFQSDCHGVRKLIAEIDLTAQTIINQIFVRQLAIENMREATIDESLYDDDSYNVYQPTLSSYEDSQVSNNQSFEVNQNALNETQNRLKKISFNHKHAKSLIEGLKNVEQTEQNLRRFRNMNNLQGTFEIDDYNQ